MKPIQTFQQGFKWCCPACFRDRAILKPLGPSGCDCGYVRDKWAIDYKVALLCALRAARNGDIEFEETCCLCAETPWNHPFRVCTGCGRESAYRWEVHVMKYFKDGNADFSKSYLDTVEYERISR